MTMIETESGKTPVIGYIRVSTRGQADDGNSLEAQTQQIRSYCDEQALKLLRIWQDTGSAAGPESHLKREGLRDAIRQAKSMQAPIIVTRVDRLARHPAILQELCRERIQVISIEEGGRVVGKNRLKMLLEEAQRRYGDLRRHTIEGVSEAKSRGIRLGNPESLKTFRRGGTVANCLRVDRKVQELADFLETVPGWETLTLRKLVDLLNIAGPLNLTSEKRDERRQWTMGSLRKPLARAKDELLFRAQLEEGDCPDILSVATSQPAGEHLPVNSFREPK